MSKTQVTKEVESKSQLIPEGYDIVKGCQRPKLLKKLKANHNTWPSLATPLKDVKDPSY